MEMTTYKLSICRQIDRKAESKTDEMKTGKEANNIESKTSSGVSPKFKLF